ncbi:MAG: alginate O-acetyltransferase AlgX-related protein [Akkermansiaceae bacterium]
MLRFSLVIFLMAIARVSCGDPLPPLPTATDSSSVGIKTPSGWYFLPAELNHLRSEASPSKLTGDANPLPAIKAFHETLAAKGIKLYLLPVPEKSLVRMDHLVSADHAAAAKGYGKVTDAFIKSLKESGVSVIETRDMLVQAAAKAGDAGDPVYCRTDSHYTPATSAMIAKTIVEHLRKDLPALSAPANQLAPVPSTAVNITIQGDLAPAGTTETLAFTPVQTSAEVKTPPAVDPRSPVLLLGDSHCLIFHAGGDMQAQGGGLPDHVGAALGFMPDVIAVRGSGATAARINLYRKARKDATYLTEKKAVIWCFAARDFTQADSWKIVPMP